MKKNNFLKIYGIFSLLTSFFLTSCIGSTQRDEQLSKEMNEISSMCPINVGMVGEISNIHQEDSVFVLTYMVSEPYKNIIWGNEELYLSPEIAYLDLVLSKEGKIESFCKSALEKGYTIKEVFKFTFENGITALLTEFELQPAIYKNIKSDKKTLVNLAKTALQFRVDYENRAYSARFQNESYSVLSDSFYIVGRIVKKESLDIVKLSPGNLRDGLKKSFSDPAMMSFAKECILSGIGISFVYKAEQDSLNNTVDSLCVKFTKEDLVKILK